MGQSAFAGAATIAAGLALLASGCSQDGPGVPDWDPPGLAEAVLSAHDKNSDGKLDEQELAGTPGLASGVRFVDEDKDKAVSRDELEKQFTSYRDQRIGLRRQMFRVTYKNRPVTDAEVKFIPEPYLAEIIEPASGTTDIEGIVLPSSEGQDFPGIRLGYYRVQINSPKVKIPEKYSAADSPLGADVSPVEDASAYGANSVVQLKLVD